MKCSVYHVYVMAALYYTSNVGALVGPSIHYPRSLHSKDLSYYQQIPGPVLDTSWHRAGKERQPHHQHSAQKPGNPKNKNTQILY